MAPKRVHPARDSSVLDTSRSHLKMYLTLILNILYIVDNIFPQHSR
jgi:hypothetical protein